MGINDQDRTSFLREVMTAFAERTGVTGAGSPKRYLWTDAFAVCNLLELARRTQDASYAALATQLVDQVHQVLGHHREDDRRRGWISGLPEEAGAEQPTSGGLRIGKALNERPPGQRMDERREWDRDGQYFHYLTRWMHALSRVAKVGRDPRYIRWAIELAQTAYDRFTYEPAAGGPRRMHWKMSIDLSRPLVDAMGQHDPLDGLVTFMELRATAEELGEPTGHQLEPRIAALASMCEGEHLATADPLGIGGLLTGAHVLVQLQNAGISGLSERIGPVLDAALPGLRHLAASQDALSAPPDDRLPFRELGLAIGLRAVRPMQTLIAPSPASFRGAQALLPRLEGLAGFTPLSDQIESFWIDPANRQSTAWKAHENINAVMLATSIAPEGYLAL